MQAPPTLDELFAAFVDTGCENSLQQLMRRSAPELRRLARRLGASSEDADDLVQETIIAAIEVADRWDRSRPLLPWLRGILTFRRAHLARDQVRRRTVANAASQELADDVVDGEPDAAALAQQTELTADVRAALANLPPRYRQALHLYLLEQRSPRQIAQGLQQPRATVRVHLHRGLQQLRLALQRWAAPVLAWLWMRPGTARNGAAARTGAVPRAGAAASSGSVVPAGLAIALSLLVGLGLWFVWCCLAAGRPADGALASGSALVAGDVSAAPVVAAAAAAPELRADAAGTAGAPVLTVLAHDADGQGVRAVGITCTRIDGRDPRLHRHQAVTDEHGAVRWSLPRQGRIALQVDRGPRIELDAVLTSRTYRVVLRSSVRVRGRVLHQDGTPAAGASIWLGSDPGDAWHGQDVARTENDGMFVLSHMPESAFLAARHPCWCSSAVVHWHAADVGPLELRLGPEAGGLALQVADPGGGAVAGAEVWVGDAMDAVPFHLADGAVGTRPPPCHGRTDDAGHVALAGLPRGTQALVVRARGFAPLVSVVDIAAAAELASAVVLQPQATLRGRVVDPAGAPIEGATVVCRGETVGGVADVVTGSDGEFSFEGPPPAPLDLAARAPGHEARVVRVESELAAPLEVCLPRVRTCTGIVHGLPVTQQRPKLRATLPPTALQPEPSFAAVRPDGSFEIAVPGIGVPRLAIQLPSEPLWRDVDAATVWDGDRARVELPADFAASAFLQGVLRTHTGAPLAGARLFVHADGRSWAELGSTDAGGAFRIGPLPPGRFGLHAETTRADLPSWWLGEHRLAAGEHRDLALSAPASGTLELDLGAEDGGEPGPMVVTIVDQALQRRAAMPQAPVGRQSLLPGDYRVFAMCDRLQWVDGAPVHVAAGAVTTLRLRLPRAARCTLVVRGLPESSVAPTLALHDLDRGGRCGQFSPEADAPMRFLAVLPVGRYELRHTDATGCDWRGGFSIDSITAASVRVVQMGR